MAPTPIDIATLSRLFDQALALPSDLREPWLPALSEEDRLHADRLRDMLARESGTTTGERLASMPQLDPDPAMARPVDRIGPYRLLREIGHGGMGSVGLAERMARERDIGALLEHPNIARLHDAGVDERGRPYLALEHIDGQPIDAWCEVQALDVRSRLRLVAQVAMAVAYAQGRLVVHRDLKPSNVPVRPDGQARLLDFGIAKLLDEALGDSRLTQDQGRSMTPHYASPEQIAGQTIAVQSDVYSLGVLLYELLTGRMPIEPRRGSLDAMEEAILQGDAAPVLAPTDPGLRLRARLLMADAMIQDHRPSQALAEIDRADAVLASALPQAGLKGARASFLRVRALAEMGRANQAQALLRTSIAQAEAEDPGTSRLAARIRIRLPSSLVVALSQDEVERIRGQGVAAVPKAAAPLLLNQSAFAVQIDAGGPDAVEGAIAQACATWLYAGNAMLRCDEADRAFADSQSVIDPLGARLPKTVPARILFYRGCAAQNAGKAEVGDRLMAESVALRPVYWRARAGQCALEAGQKEQAVEWADQARSALKAQAVLSPFFEAPLPKLEQALGVSPAKS